MESVLIFIKHDVISNHVIFTDIVYFIINTSAIKLDWSGFVRLAACSFSLEYMEFERIFGNRS